MGLNMSYFMKKKELMGLIKLLCFLFILCIMNFSMTNKEEAKYKNILLELGAFPYQIEKGKAYIVQDTLRIDVNGWISPYDSEFVYLTEEEIKKYNFPPKKNRILEWYQKYKTMLDINEYEKSKNSQYLTIMIFLLEIIYNENIEIENIEKLIALAKSGIGLEEKIIRVLMRYRCYKNSIEIFKSIDSIFLEKYELLELLFPLPKESEKDYLFFLKSFIRNKKNNIFFKWHFMKLLYQMNKERYKKDFFKISFKCIYLEKNDLRRSNIFKTLISTKDSYVLGKMFYYIGHDPDTVCRESIISKLCDIGYIDDNIVNVIDKISVGESNRHGSRYLHYEPTSWQDHLVSYLSCINKMNSNYAQNAKMNEILNRLEKINFFQYRDPQDYFDFFKIYQKTIEGQASTGDPKIRKGD